MNPNMFLLVVMLSLASCASFDLKLSSNEINSFKNIPEYYRLDIAEIHQTTDYTCATVSVSMGIRYALDLNYELDELKQWEISGASYSEAKKLGNDMSALVRLCNYYGVNSKYINMMTIEYLQYQISSGNPVVINIRPDFPRYNTHAILVVGYDKEKKEFYCCDPSDCFHIIKEDRLNEIWSASLAEPRGMSVRSGLIIYKMKNSPNDQI